MTRFRVLLPIVAFLCLALVVPASAAGEKVVLPVDDVQWGSGPAALPEGAEMAVISGHPGEEGAFVIRLRFPENYQVPAHWHSKTEHLTIIEGTFRFGVGDKLDKEASAILPAGSFVRIPANTRHYAWTEEGVVVQIHGDGPFDVHFVDPEDDPREHAAK